VIDYVRISREKVAENRERLLQVATDQFREHGIDGVGVADLMKEAGMSLGSFYGYFDSKEHLVSECCTHTIAESREKIASDFSRPLPNAVEKTVDEYLSIKHRDERSRGCGLAALGSEFAHKPRAVHEAATPELISLFYAMARSLHGSSRKKKRDQSIAMMASLMGGIILSRMTDDAKLSQDILEAVKASVKSSVRAC
jgi:TetR/AcrR family transcriptional repressor of nem operon